MDDPVIRDLRAALAVSPDNLPLRLLLARSLAERHAFEEAGEAYRAALQTDPASAEARLGLARCNYHRGELSTASVILEELVQSGEAGAETYHLLARCLLADGKEGDAAGYYGLAKAKDGSIIDEDLEHLLLRQRAAPADPPPPDPGAPVPGVDGVDADEDAAELAYLHGDPSARYQPLEERPAEAFADVGGMEDVKEEIRLKIIYPLQHSELYAAYGKGIGGGILLYGPPGCGKTYLARATAGEIRSSFMDVGISDVLDMYIGQSERNLGDVFETARGHAPCVLFFDEVDALAASRRDMRQSASRQVINQFLLELDGVSKDNAGVLVMAATNAPWQMDGAFRRPGRFDRMIFVPPPDEAARASILRLKLAGKPAAEVDTAAVAARCPHYTGADLANVVDVAVEAKLQEAMKRGVPQPLTTKDLLKALKRVKPSAKEWFTTVRNHILYANEHGYYDEVHAYMRAHKL